MSLPLEIYVAFLLIISPIFNAQLNADDDIVNYYENLIEKRLDEARHYSPPTDATRHKPTVERDRQDFGKYDFVIIGAGATGTVIANRLSEIKEWNILLLEAGEFGDNFTEIPSMGFEVALSHYNWGFKSVPQTTACLGFENEECPYPRGKGVGGTTLFNGLAYVRGHPIDYDRWADMGNHGWSYDDVLPYFKKSEDFHKTNPLAPVNISYHGRGGDLSVEYFPEINPFLKAFLQGNEELGFNLTDYNTPQQIGASPIQQNTRKGRRADGGSAFIKPISGRSNLRIMTNSFVTKISFVKQCKYTIIANAVHFTHNGETYKVRVNKEVILSAGVISSPQILMLSGIGPKNHLNKHNITVVKDLEVGSTLRDHSQYYGLTFSSNVSVAPRPLTSYIRDYLNGRGPLAIPGPNTAVGFYQSSLQKIPNYPDLEVIMISPNATSKAFRQVLGWKNESYEATWGGTDVTKSFTMYVINLHQLSVGTVRLKSSSPFDYPLIDPQFFSDPDNRDIKASYEGIQFVMKLISTEAFQKIGAKYQGKPLEACKEFEDLSEDYWYCSLRQLSFNVYHPVGTCPMGPDPSTGAVVDHELKVHGIDNLRVADASVFPFTFSGHPNAPCVMVGEKVSDIVKKCYDKI